MDRARRGRPRSLRRCPSPFHLFSCQSRCIMRFRARMHGFTGRKAQAQGRVAADAYGDSAKSYFLGCDASVAVKQCIMLSRAVQHAWHLQGCLQELGRTLGRRVAPGICDGLCVTATPITDFTLIDIVTVGQRYLLFLQDDEHDDNCLECGKEGELVCCDSCPRTYHRACSDLPLHGRLPAMWHCPWCRNGAVDLSALERFLAARPGPGVRIMPGPGTITTMQCD